MVAVTLHPGLRLHVVGPAGLGAGGDGRDGPVAGLLVGGASLQVTPLGAAAAACLRRWQLGEPVRGERELHLARRLHDRGVLTLRADGAAYRPEDVTVVVPVRDRAGGLERCLRGVGACGVLLVVDDGSRDPAAIARVAAAYGARLLRRATSGGPAAARNTGLAQVRTPLVAFVDSDCELPAGWLEGLLPALLDGRVTMVAPRVVGAGGRGLLARFELTHGPLDLGAQADVVLPGGRTGYLPGAVLLCRRTAVAGGFDERLRVGEDVDLVRRAAAAPGAVRYDPSVVVRHATRTAPAAWLAQRVGYGSGAARLDQRHPGAVAPVVVSAWALPGAAAVLTGHPLLAAGSVVLTALGLRSQLPAAPGRDAESARLAAAGLGWTLVGLSEATARVWLPALLVGACRSRRVRLLTAAALIVHLQRSWRAARPVLPLVAWVALRLADDGAYGYGVWAGALRHCRPRAVLPAVRWPEPTLVGPREDL